MFDDAQVIQDLGISGLTPEQQDTIINEYQIQVGSALAGDLSEEQLEEFEAIIDGNQEVIDRWLQENAPDYKSSEAFQELSKGYDEDPEKVPADKVYASMAWVEKYAGPDFADKVNAIKEHFKADIEQYK